MRLYSERLAGVSWFTFPASDDGCSGVGVDVDRRFEAADGSRISWLGGFGAGGWLDGASASIREVGHDRWVFGGFTHMQPAQ